MERTRPGPTAGERTRPGSIIGGQTRMERLSRGSVTGERTRRASPIGVQTRPDRAKSGSITVTPKEMSELYLARRYSRGGHAVDAYEEFMPGGGGFDSCDASGYEAFSTINEKRFSRKVSTLRMRCESSASSIDMGV